MAVNGTEKPQQVGLIRAVRSLDDDDDLPLPDKIQKIWLLLSASKGIRLHAVEETILRWLCKHMAGNTESAELVRRYPLTWTVLAHCFSKIPPQSLGRSLADRRFVSILHQTLKDLSASHRNTPATSTKSNGASSETRDSSKKRKRTGLIPSDVENLRTSEGCALSAIQVFEALEQLLQPGNSRDSATGPETRVGFEHIKSLFSSSSDEIRDLTSNLLWLCHLTLRSTEFGISQEQRQWIRVLSAVWDLRLHSKEESYEFATHLYQPICAILSALKKVDGVETAKGSMDVKEVWTRELDRFLSIYLIRPSRQRFALDGSVQVINTALDVTGKSPVASSIVLWDVASRSSRDTADPSSKSEHASWAQKVFVTVLQHLGTVDSSRRNRTLSRLLVNAVQTESIPSTETLRELYNDYALDSEKPDWELSQRIIACDPDVFIMDIPTSENLFNNITTASGEGSERRSHIIQSVVLPLMDAFARARDFSSFAKHWYRCLCLEHEKTDSSKTVDKSIWVEVEIRDRFSATAQNSLSGTQLKRLLESLESETPVLGAQLVVAEAICSGLTEHGTFELVGPTMSSMVCGAKKYKKLPSSFRALRWRIARVLAEWETSDGVHQLWVELGAELSKSLRKGELSDDETFEAYKCCYGLLLANRPDGNDENELSVLLLSFLEKIQSVSDSGEPDRIPARYLGSIFADLPRLAEAWNHTDKSIAQIIVSLYRVVGLQPPGSTSDLALSKHIPSLLDNFSVRDQEALVEALITPSIHAVEGDEKKPGWTQPQGLSLILTILEFPREALTKSRRKSIMGSWKSWVTQITKRASKDKSYATALLRLLVRVMELPTFYEKMEFDDLLSMTTNLTFHDEGILRLTQAFVSRTINHVMASADEILTTYCKDVSAYMESLKAKKSSTPQYIILTSVASALNKDGIRKPVLAILDPDMAAKKIRHIVKEGLNRFEVKDGSHVSPETLSANRIPLEALLDCAQSVASGTVEKPIAISDETLQQLESLSKSYIQFQPELGWKLRIFLVGNCPPRYDAASVLALLREAADTTDEDLVHGLVRSYVKGKDPSASQELLETLIDDDSILSGSLGPLLGVGQIVDTSFGSSPGSAGSQDEASVIAKLHVKTAWMLHQASSLGHFKCLSNLLLKFMDRHSTSMSQFNVEITLTTVIRACSSSGPRIEGLAAAGEIYEKLYQLVAVIIRKHRHRLEGHFPVLIGALQALLGVLLANPAASSSVTRSTSHLLPPWLHARLQARHATKFTRLLTLICEPSAAAVSRSRINTLDSARDVAKRLAGRDMFTVLETYIKLQLEGDVPRDVRKALETGMYSILNITPEGGRRVLNESIDSNGRAVFKQMYAEYTKFGTWTGV